MPSPPPILRFTGITKRFHKVTVLDGVSFALPPGRTLGVVGENGAGKSTLMNILGGNLRPDDGTMAFNGNPYRPESPRDASANGIAFIHQELNLFTNLSIAENIFINSFPRPWRFVPWIHRRRLREETRRLLAQVRLDLDPETLVEALPAGERQLVEIAKALSFDARLILLDEPTTSLTGPEARRLFSLMDRMRSNGIAMIYISHNLTDVLRVWMYYGLVLI
jgi:ABC-type sugar transport system ATPase subunit